MSPSKVRLRFAKRGPIRLVSHHDLMRCLERTIRRAALPVAQSQGFNPRPKMVFPLALGLGIEGCREVLELELAEAIDPQTVLARLQAQAPPGFDFLEAEAAGGKASQVAAVQYSLAVPEDRHEALERDLTAWLACPEQPYVRHRPDRTQTIDLRPFVLAATLDRPSGELRFRLKMSPSGSARPEELVDSLGLRDLTDGGAVLVRTEVELAPAPAAPADSSTIRPKKLEEDPISEDPSATRDGPDGPAAASEAGAPPDFSTRPSSPSDARSTAPSSLTRPDPTIPQEPRILNPLIANAAASGSVALSTASPATADGGDASIA